MAILPKPLQRFIVDGNHIAPQYVKPTTGVFQLEAQLIDNYRYSIDDTYELLNDTLEPMCQAIQRHKLIRGFIHILDKRLSYDEPGDIDPVQLRLSLFEKAARVSAEDFPKKTWRDEIIRSTANAFKIPSESVDERLYSDLKDQRKIKAFDDIEPDELLAEYNLSLAQSLIIYARSLSFTLNLGAGESSALRRLFRHLRFFNLLFEVKQVADNTWQFKVDGPGAVLPQPQKYSIELASFLRTLFEFKDWIATAEVDPDGAGKYKIWQLKPDDFTPPHIQVFERIPEEAMRLIARIRELAPEIEIEESPAIIQFSPQAVWIPDFTATIRTSNAKAHIEILGYWRADYLNRRLKALKKAPSNLILVLSDKLKVDKAALEETKIPIVSYKTTPLPKNIIQAILLHAK